MKKLFYVGLVALGLFEILNVYFIMPMPGSQRMNSLNVAYFLYSYRWFFRALFGLMIIGGVVPAIRNSRHKWIPVVSMFIVFIIVYLFNFKMSADQMFKQPGDLIFKTKATNTLSDSSIVVGVEVNGEVKAYPIRFIGYHHQVQDVAGGKPIIVTYCTVCRTGRVFEPLVKGRLEKFRLVGMDHFNAMFEDESTKSWWRQANGEAVTGRLKGEVLPELESFQMSVGQLFKFYPHALVMQPDEMAARNEKYDTLAKYERGKSKSDLTRTDSLSWKDKSWVIGVELGGASKAYDWIEMRKNKIVNDKVGEAPVVIVMSADEKSFAAFKRPADSMQFIVRNDSLITSTTSYSFNGIGKNGERLQRVRAYQEFWHSWKTFHPKTITYKQDQVYPN